jgi:hypothetical protein
VRGAGSHCYSSCVHRLSASANCLTGAHKKSANCQMPALPGYSYRVVLQHAECLNVTACINHQVS